MPAVAESVRPQWPAAVFDAAVLRGLDDRARREIEAAGELVSLAKGATLFREGERADAFFVVASGALALDATRRGGERPTPLRSVGPGDVLGEEATVGLERRATATAREHAVVARIPAHVFRRAAERSGKGEFAARIERTLRRAATRDLFATVAFARDLDRSRLEEVLDAVTYRSVARGESIYLEGDRATDLWLVAQGLIQIQTDDGERLHVRAYVTRGDVFGEAELAAGERRRASAVASGPSMLVALPAAVARPLLAALPDGAASLGRVAHQAIAGATQNATRHVLFDLYRLQVARSLLVIDLESCARCGHCAWACASMYGTARIVRRGDKMVARVGKGDDALPKSLLLPNSCQHCEHPACMIDCPTGAIGRDPEGDVFIRPELCTGCGACAKACPWDNIAMAERPADSPRPSGTGDFASLAVKCDLCHDYEAPACVQACPTDAIRRIDPNEELADVRALFGPRTAAAASSSETRPSSAPVTLGAAIAAASIGAVGATMQARGAWAPAHGIGLVAGVAAAIGMVGLTAYAWPKRRIRSWMRPRTATRAATSTSVVAPHVRLHVALGVVTVALALAHAPASGGGGLGAALRAMLFASSALGALTWAAYRVVPRRLARIERSAALPEDFVPARRELVDRLYRDVSGKSDLVKRLVEKVLVPYSRSTLGPLALVLSGRTLRDEERALRGRIDVALEGRGRERLGGLDGLVRIVVELRALTAQRVLLTALRVGLPLHIATFGLALGALALHVVFAIRRTLG